MANDPLKTAFVARRRFTKSPAPCGGRRRLADQNTLKKVDNLIDTKMPLISVLKSGEFAIRVVTNLRHTTSLGECRALESKFRRGPGTFSRDRYMGLNGRVHISFAVGRVRVNSQSLETSKAGPVNGNWRARTAVRRSRRGPSNIRGSPLPKVTLSGFSFRGKRCVMQRSVSRNFRPQFWACD